MCLRVANRKLGHFAYDTLSRLTDETGAQGTAHSDWDLAGRRAQLTYPGTGLAVNTDYSLADEITAIRENNATSGIGVLASYTYDNLGRRTGVAYGNGSSASYGYDPVSRLSSLNYGDNYGDSLLNARN